MTRLFGVCSVFILSTQLMGCAQSTSGPGWTLLSSGLGGPVSAADTRPDDVDLVMLRTPTVANKTLSAMALERSTGLKPVPSRLVKFD